jgi:hypothetical protein
MTTPNETNSTRTNRPNYWLRAIEFRKHQLGREYRSTLGDKAREGVSDEDYATTMATLEKMARNLGWDDSQEQGPQGHGFGRGRGFGHGHRHPGMMRGFGPRGFHGPFGAQEPDETKPEA